MAKSEGWVVVVIVLLMSLMFSIASSSLGSTQRFSKHVSLVRQGFEHPEELYN